MMGGLSRVTLAVTS